MTSGKEHPNHRLTDLLEDVVGAEFVSAVDTAEVIGAHSELVTNLHAATLQYWQATCADNKQAIASLTALKSTADLTTCVNTYISQRLSHGLVLAEAVVMANLKEQQKVLEIHTALWAPFINIVDRDLHQPPSEVAQ